MLLPPVRIRTITVALVLLIVALNANAKDVQVLFFSFEVPDSWIVDGQGGDKLFATGASQMYLPPLVLAEGCVPYGQKDCSGFKHPDPAREMQRCAGVVGERIPRTDAIVETRWVCAPFTVDGLEVSVGTVLFETKGAILMVAYAARTEDLAVSAFLDKVARSLKVSSS
jgi:hypothetical protein